MTLPLSSADPSRSGAPPAFRMRRLPAALPAGALLALHARMPKRYPHFLESAATGTAHSRYDILFAFPGETLALDKHGQVSGVASGRSQGDFLAAFDDWWHREGGVMESPPSPLPFTGGWFVYLGYELAAQVEPTLALPAAPHALPTAFATRFPAALIVDHVERAVFLVAEAEREDLLDVLEQDFKAGVGDPAFLAAPAGTCLAGPLGEEADERYLDGAQKCIDYIFAGDVFQVNLSRAWRCALREGLSHAGLYNRLRRSNPAPFAGLATFADSAIISSSPERLIDVRGKFLQTRPIAGTRPRGSSGMTDIALSSELLAHPKERAEHIMLVDLERNDISRVCRPGSVKVSEMMVVESYAHVHHIVSNIRGELVPEATPGAIIRAVFPGGTITGCPKVRCMEIIAELEDGGRGAYTGSMGYINRAGGMDLNILIRTMVREGQTLSFRAGAGIVADSVPARELEETRAKAAGLIRALLDPR